jgi:hypothetical protein
MRVLELRLLTAVAVAGACTFAAAKGWDIVGVSIADGVAARQSEAEVLKRWIGVPGIGFSARTTELTPGGADAANIVSKRRDELIEVLSVRPLSSEYWLSLLRMKLAAGETSEKVAAALVMSALTGANEGYLMSRRAIFGLSLWEAMPPEVRRRAAMDTLAAPLSDRRRTEIQKLLAAKSEKVRQEVKAILLEQGITPTRLDEIGLSERQSSGS